MKYLHTLLSFLFITISIHSFGQKLDLDRHFFNHNYRSLPLSPVPPDARTYQVKVLSGLSQPINDSKAESFHVSGFRRNQSNAGVNINFRFDDIIIAKSSPIERVQINKDRAGKEIGRTMFYSMEILYTLNSSCQVSSRTGNVLYSNIENPRRSYLTPEYGTLIDAQNFWFNNIGSLKNKMVEDVLNDYMIRSSNLINTQIGYPELSINKNLWISDTPKHPENEDFARNTRALANKIKNLSSIDDVGRLRNDLENEEKYFQSVASRFIADGKADKKIRYGAYYNLAMLYLCTDRPELAIAEAEKLIANDYDKTDGKIIKMEAEKFISGMNINKMNTTHFNDDFIQNQR